MSVRAPFAVLSTSFTMTSSGNNSFEGSTSTTSLGLRVRSFSACSTFFADLTVQPSAENRFDKRSARCVSGSTINSDGFFFGGILIHFSHCESYRNSHTRADLLENDREVFWIHDARPRVTAVNIHVKRFRKILRHMC